MKRCGNKVLLLLIPVVALLVAQLPALAQDKDPWAPLQFLEGTWSGLGSGQPGEMTSSSTEFYFELDKNIMIRENKAEFAPKAGEKAGIVHKDLLIIYQEPGAQAFRAIYFDNEGHVINYTVSFPAEQTAAVFDSGGTDKGPRFRLVYEKTGEGTLSTEFFVAPPGGELKSYVKGTVKRKA